MRNSVVVAMFHSKQRLNEYPPGTGLFENGLRRIEFSTVQDLEQVTPTSILHDNEQMLFCLKTIIQSVSRDRAVEIIIKKLSHQQLICEAIWMSNTNLTTWG